MVYKVNRYIVGQWKTRGEPHQDFSLLIINDITKNTITGCGLRYSQTKTNSRDNSAPENGLWFSC